MPTTYPHILTPAQFDLMQLVLRGPRAAADVHSGTVGALLRAGLLVTTGPTRRTNFPLRTCDLSATEMGRQAFIRTRREVSHALKIIFSTRKTSSGHSFEISRVLPHLQRRKLIRVRHGIVELTEKGLRCFPNGTLLNRISQLEENLTELRREVCQLKNSSNVSQLEL